MMKKMWSSGAPPVHLLHGNWGGDLPELCRPCCAIFIISVCTLRFHFGMDVQVGRRKTPDGPVCKHDQRIADRPTARIEALPHYHQLLVRCPVLYRGNITPTRYEIKPPHVLRATIERCPYVANFNSHASNRLTERYVQLVHAVMSCVW